MTRILPLNWRTQYLVAYHMAPPSVGPARAIGLATRTRVVLSTLGTDLKFSLDGLVHVVTVRTNRNMWFTLTIHDNELGLGERLDVVLEVHLTHHSGLNVRSRPQLMPCKMAQRIQAAT